MWLADWEIGEMRIVNWLNLGFNWGHQDLSQELINQAGEGPVCLSDSPEWELDFNLRESGREELDRKLRSD